MTFEKKVISDLTLCYCVAPLTYRGKQHFLVASEKEFPCLLFDAQGNLVDKIWDGPGGTMSMQQVPGTDGVFLAIHKFYSPNNSKEAKIVLVWPEKDGWKVRTLVDLPYVHRFDILSRDGVNYLIAGCLKSGYEYKDDWRFPGRVCVCELPEDLPHLPESTLLRMTELKGGMLKNHGYCRSVKDGVMTGIVTCEEGVFRFTPPALDGAWRIEQLIGDPASDAVFADMDGDGREELLTISPFHGDTLRVYRWENGSYHPVWQYAQPVPFAHAICAAAIGGKPCVIIGHRKGTGDLLLLSYEAGQYQVEIIDRDVGTANVLHDVVDGNHVLLAANREINEVAYYTMKENE